MALKRRISYQWQLFIPLVATLWIVILSMAYIQYANEREYRKDTVDSQLDIVTKRIVATYETDIDPTQFVDFICRYYIENPLYDRLRVSVYKDGMLTRSWGEPISLDDSDFIKEENDDSFRSPGDFLSDHYFYYKAEHSADNRVVVYTALPVDSDIMAFTLPSRNALLVLILLGVVMTILAYISTRYFGRNISILRTIAENAANDTNFLPAMDYPHDELGDISRQITTMYNQRTKAMERQKQEHKVAMHAIEEKARNKRQLTNNINHELRTPIGVIKGYIDTIIDNPTMDEASRMHFITKAKEHVERLVNLIADVSAITRLEEGSDMISTEDINFHDLVFTVVSDLEESKILGQMSFNFDIPLECHVNGNFNLLRGMIINLAKNAASYSKGDMCEVILTNEDDDFYHFEFRDNGTGVGEQHLPHLFDRFYRIDSGRARKTGGTGLGLPIVQNTVLAHGGTIEVRNGELGGLAFNFTLPKFKDD